jgi:hypothetical protein
MQPPEATTAGGKARQPLPSLAHFRGGLTTWALTCRMPRCNLQQGCKGRVIMMLTITDADEQSNQDRTADSASDDPSSCADPRELTC